MSITDKRIPSKVMAYTQRDTFSDTACQIYFAYTERGIRPASYQEDRTLNLEVADLLFAHAVASREPHSLLEGLWLDGMDDYPLGLVLIDYLRQDCRTFLRKRLAYERCYRLCAKVRGHLPYKAKRRPISL